jgi:transposase-like protein
MSTAMSFNDGGTASLFPQEQTHKKKRRFSVKEKLCLVRQVKRRIDQDKVSIRTACRDLNIGHSLYLEWTKQLYALNEAKKRNSRAKSLCFGRASILKPVEAELTRFIFELREQGIGVTTPMVRLKAISLATDFSEKSQDAQYQAVHRFVKSLGLVYRVSTTESQKDPRETLAQSVDFLRNMHPKLTQPCRHEDWIINMDQTPIPFTYNARKTLEVVGRRTVFVRKSTCDTKRATFAMTVTASGKVFKTTIEL